MYDVKKLEFDKIIKLLEKKCVNEVTKESFHEDFFYKDKAALEIELDNVDEALVCLQRMGTVPLTGIVDIRFHLKRANLGSMLNIDELLDIKHNLEKARDNKTFAAKVIKAEIKLPNYQSIVDDLYYDKYIYTILNDNIKDKMIVDTASNELFEVRKGLKNTAIQINDVLRGIVSKSKMLSDNIITMRDGRSCVPVKAEYKNKFNGIVHDVSASGETYFIEPIRVVELSNKVNVLKQKELKEIDKILAAYTNLVCTIKEALENNFYQFVYLDSLFAKAKFAKEYNCHKQTIGDSINLIGAFHILLDQKTVVKNNIAYDNYKQILITGPNTGGKTVTLKTLGLMVLMNQFGLLLPTDTNSTICMFNNVFCDIGDEQSIEQSLSTFSGHMTNIVRILNNVDKNSLVLLDELCSGTDPKEGATLAIAILDKFLEKDCLVMATTHYSELKAYAYNNVNIVNASTEFNVDTLRPTYKLRIGIPGKSNAFDISLRLGLSNDIVDSARNSLSENDISLTTLINKLENRTTTIDNKIIEYDKLIETEEIKRKELDRKMEELKLKDYNNQEKAKQAAKDIINEAIQKANTIIKDLQEYQKGVIKQHELNDFKRELNEEKEKYEPKHLTSDNNINYAVGDTVQIISYNNASAKIIKILPNNSYEAQMGLLKVTVNKKYLKPLMESKKKVKRAAVVYKKNINVSLVLDLRGMRYEEAHNALDKYLDDLVVANMKQATIIHGYGTLIIQKMVWDYLGSCKFIQSYEFAAATNGGHGATEIKLK